MGNSLQPPSLPPEMTQNKLFGLRRVVWIVVGLVVAVGVAGGLWLTQQSAPSNQLPATSNQQSATSSQQLETSSLQLATSTAGSSTSSLQDWKTYRNEEYGFEFRYPENYRIAREEYFFVEILPPDEYYEFGPSFAIYTLINPKRLSGMRQYAEESFYDARFPDGTWAWGRAKTHYNYSDYLKSQEEIHLNGVDGLKVVWVDDYFQSERDVRVFIPKDDLVYFIKYSNSLDYVTIFERMLSTFKFIK